jgi:2-oxoglutarate dehydrogenase complex dehydrogenase (E1) component-like enzyme
MLEDFQELLDRAHRETKAALPEKRPAEPRPDHEETEGVAAPSADPAIDETALAALLDGVFAVPEGFAVHPKLAKQFERRRELADGGRIDWGLAELLAFGSLVTEGVPVRLSGEDSGRGTFSQRHAVVVDHTTGAEHMPLQHIAAGQAPFHVYDSLLSEFAVLGFEYGYSVTRPEALVLWEAQFGDFVNGGQVIIDQYISSAEEKWAQRSSLVLILPHGFEGQGPEHSSARFERFLQLCAEGNLRVCQPSTPAQYFHLLRRQAHDPVRKPLIVLTPKSLLRLPAAASAPGELTTGGFREVIDDPARGAVTRRLLLASGRVAYDLEAERRTRGRDDVAIVRLEQLYPLPRAALIDLIVETPDSAELVWVQDEPRNMGAWSFLRERLTPALGGRELRYAGRPWSASPASGSKSVHEAEARALLDEAFSEPA